MTILASFPAWELGYDNTGHERPNSICFAEVEGDKYCTLSKKSRTYLSVHINTCLHSPRAKAVW